MARNIDNSETKELIGFYQMGLDSIIQGNYSITCYDGKDPSWADDEYHPKTEYIIEIEKTGIVEFQKTIDSFFGITSYVSNNNKLYLGCGDKIKEISPNVEETPIEETKEEEEHSLDFELSNHVTLPTYLDNLIYGEFFGARYQPDHQRYEYNLDLTEEELLVYLGTYFPRSFGESMCIFTSVIKFKEINSELSSKDCINILDIGCGSGGEILGLLHALEGCDDNSIPINIYTYDGNQLVQDILMELVSQFQIAAKTKRRIQIYTNVKQVGSSSDIEWIKANSNTFSFDFILCNKMCNELISRAEIADAYYLMCKAFAPLLDSNGLLLILDVTTKDEKESKFYSELLNEQTNRFVNENNKDFSTLLPITCALHPECIKPCFTQQKFYISHSQKKRDLSKVAYRIIARKNVCEGYIMELGDEKEIVTESNKNLDNPNYCSLT